jgi:hypothetical protein
MKPYRDFIFKLRIVVTSFGQVLVSFLVLVQRTLQFFRGRAGGIAGCGGFSAPLLLFWTVSAFGSGAGLGVGDGTPWQAFAENEVVA